MGSIEFNLSWNSGTQSFLMMTTLSSTYLFQVLGGTLMDDKVGDDRTNRASHSTTMYLFVEAIIIDEKTVKKNKFQQRDNIISSEVGS